MPDTTPRRTIARITLVVPDYDAAIAFYRDRLGFDVLEDTDLAEGKRWVVLRPVGATETALLLAQADGDRQAAAIGNQTGGRVGFFLHTDDFARDHEAMRRRLSRGAAPRALRHRRCLCRSVWKPVGPASACLNLAPPAGRARQIGPPRVLAS